jgi:hypothetical protein
LGSDGIDAGVDDDLFRNRVNAHLETSLLGLASCKGDSGFGDGRKSGGGGFNGVCAS